MPFTVRISVLAAGFLALASISVVRAYAIPDALNGVDYRRRNLNVRIIEESSTHTVHTSLPVGPAPRLGQRKTDYDSKLELFNKYYTQVNINNNNLKNYASRASSSKNDKSYQQQCATELSSFYTNFNGAQNILQDLGSDKGLANYDRNNELETKLKDLVNFNKNTLHYVTVIVEECPVLGPVLGPIVGDIKCLLDSVLNTVENAVDGILNSLSALLGDVIKNYADSMCKGGCFELLGLCIDLGSIDLGNL